MAIVSGLGITLPASGLVAAGCYWLVALSRLFWAAVEQHRLSAGQDLTDMGIERRLIGCRRPIAAC